ncbi:hypothetical protein PENSPDRAFT_655972 [Peniophora sp. CONT]|nr:hypothetical protein PENSPDRAFT_655972 [Peniophora sp. CONT]
MHICPLPFVLSLGWFHIFIGLMGHSVVGVSSWIIIVFLETHDPGSLADPSTQALDELRMFHCIF